MLDSNGSVIDSPFDYKRNALLYLPSDMPPPDQHNYQQALEEAIQKAALAAGGRTLVLFTSHSHLRASADAIRTPLAAAGLTVIQQGEGSRSRNLRDFRANPSSVLMGTSSYWEGIDLPGDQLVCLIIVRLPFAVPTDPLYAARSRLYEDAFHEYAVPEAVIRLRQGFGRLIRSTTDRGVVVLLDSRLWQRGYGQVFLDALPDAPGAKAPLSHLGEAIHGWLNNPAQTHAASNSNLSLTPGIMAMSEETGHWQKASPKPHSSVPADRGTSEGRARRRSCSSSERRPGPLYREPCVSTMASLSRCHRPDPLLQPSQRPSAPLLPLADSHARSAAWPVSLAAWRARLSAPESPSP